MARKPKEANGLIRNGLPASVKLLQQNINRIIHAKINGKAICLKFVPLAWPHRLAVNDLWLFRA